MFVAFESQRYSQQLIYCCQSLPTDAWNYQIHESLLQIALHVFISFSYRQRETLVKVICYVRKPIQQIYFCSHGNDCFIQVAYFCMVAYKRMWLL